MSNILSTDNGMAQAVSDHLLNDLVGNWFLYATSMFVELSVVLVTATFIYHSIAGLWRNRKHTRRTDPVNLHKWKYLFLTSAIFLRAIMDAVMLLTWDEVTWGTFEWMITTDRIFTLIAYLPFMAFAYIWFRAGPSIEFQLLRQPIPTDLMAGWKQIRKPLSVIGLIMLMCALVTLAKA